MSYCINCGMKLSDGVRFCTGCGTPVPSAKATEVSPPQNEIKVEPRQAAPAPATVQGIETPPPAGSRYAPMSTGGFIGIFLLMLIPIVNLILLIVWACGGCRKVNQTNLARAMLVLMLIGIVLSMLLALVGGLFLGSLGGLDGIKDSIINKAVGAAGE